MEIWDPSQYDEDIDLTPMIDIVFLLIVFFMTVASMITAEKIPVEMSIALHSNIPEDFGERTTVTIKRDGSIYAGMFEVDLQRLEEILIEEREYDPTVKVFIRADRSTEHQFVNEVMQACAAAGLNNVIFAAYLSEK